MLLMQHTQTSFNPTTEGRSDSTNIFAGGESDALEDLKLLDFPIYDDNFDDTSLDEMFSPGSSFDPTASTPTTPTTCSSYAPSPTALAVTTSATDVDIVMTTVCHTPVSEVSSHAGSSLLPGFMETYSPRYRTATPSLNPMFFKFEDMPPEADASQSSSSFSTSVATSSQPMSLTGSPASRTSTATYPVAPFLKQEPPDPFESQTTTTPIPEMQQTHKRNNPKRHVTAGGKHHQIVSRFTSPAATFSSGRSSVDNKRIVDSRTPLSSGSSSSTHSTMSPPLTPLTPTVVKSERSAHVPPPHPHSGRTSSSLCAVCGDNAACQHYGVRTCEGCKGFFKRTVQKGAKYVCLGSKDCVVDKRRRNRCQFCRFQKCLSVGMVKEVVRTDELKGRRGRLPSKPKSPQESPPSPPVSTITALVRAHLDTNPDMANTHMQQPEYVSLETIDEESVHQFYRIFESSLDAMRAFCEKCPGFSELEKRDQEILFQSALVELFVLRFAYRNAVGADRIVFCNGWALHRKHVELVMGSRWLSCIEKLSQNLQNIDIDISAFACLCALALVTDRQGLTSVSRIDQLQSKIISSLRDHCTYNSQAQKKSNYFSKILSVLPELRSLSSEGVKRMQRLDQVIALPESLKALFSNASSSLLS